MNNIEKFVGRPSLCPKFQGSESRSLQSFRMRNESQFLDEKHVIEHDRSEDFEYRHDLSKFFENCNLLVSLLLFPHGLFKVLLGDFLCGAQVSIQNFKFIQSSLACETLSHTSCL